MGKVYANLKVNGEFIYNNNPQDGYVLTTDNDGLVSWTASAALISVASDTSFGHIKVGSGLTMSSTGHLSVSNSGSGNSYSPGIGLTLSGSNLDFNVGTGLTVSGNYINTMVNESKAIYIDASYGNDTTGKKYDLTMPFLTWAGAIAVAVSGDWIVFNAGSYAGGYMSPVDNVNVFCKHGVKISGGFTINNSITWKFLGNAIFTSSNALVIGGSGQTYDIQFDFDKIEGIISWGIYAGDTSSPSFKLLVNCNSITASSPIRLNGGSVYDVVINCRYKLSSYGSWAILLGNPTTVVGTSVGSGSVVINCPVIENTGTTSNRTVISLLPYYINGKIVINSSIIRATSTTFTDSGSNNLGCVVWFDAGDNILINGDLEGGVLPCIINRSAGGIPHYGNITFNGNMYSDREIVQHYQKYSNGNGWHNIIIKNGYIRSKGIGLSNAMFHRANLWNNVMNGVPGDIQLINCIVHNQNYNTSLDAAIVRDDVFLTSLTGWTIKKNNFQAYNSFFYIEGTIGYLSTTIQSNKEASFHNVRSNVDKNSVVTDTFSPTGLIVDANLIIPKTKI